MNGFANLALYSASRAASLAGSFFSSRKMISTAPFAPITAISPLGHATLAPARAELGWFVHLPPKDDLACALPAQHRDLGVGPREVHVTAQVLGAHHVVGTAVGLARDDGDLRHRALGERVEQLGAVLDDA